MANRGKNNVAWRQLRHRLFHQQNGNCFYCGFPMRHVIPSPAAPDACTLDHAHPVARNGSSMRANVVACCNRCNHLKGDLPFEAFMAKIKADPPPPHDLKQEFIPDIGKVKVGPLVVTEAFRPGSVPLGAILGPALAKAFPDWAVQNGFARPPDGP